MRLLHHIQEEDLLWHWDFTNRFGWVYGGV